MISTPSRFRRYFWLGFDRRAIAGDEMLGISIGQAYFGIYPTNDGVEICWGLLNDQEAL